MSGRIEVEQIHGYGFRVNACTDRGESTTMFDVEFRIFPGKAAQDLANSYALNVGRILDVDAVTYGPGPRYWSSCPACTGDTFHIYATCEAEAERADRLRESNHRAGICCAPEMCPTCYDHGGHVREVAR